MSVAFLRRIMCGQMEYIYNTTKVREPNFDLVRVFSTGFSQIKIRVKILTRAN